MLSDRAGPPEPDKVDEIGIPKIVPPLPRPNPRALRLPWTTAFEWLKAGWGDLKTNPLPSLMYGVMVFLITLIIVAAIFRTALDYILFPALSGFLIVGPLIASGLYEKSRRLERNERTSFAAMVFVRPRSTYQALFLGIFLLSILLLWMRAAVLIYALFFGIKPFPGTDQILPMLFLTPTGWLLLLVGSVIGALFAAFAFAVSVFSVPMLLEEKTDALSAMGISMAMVWNNLPVMLCWGAIVMGLFVLSALTGFVALIVVFPVLGHATWHAYRALRSGEGERVFFSPA